MHGYNERYFQDSFGKKININSVTILQCDLSCSDARRSFTYPAAVNKNAILQPRWEILVYKIVAN
jgi:hypothetical protein